MAAKRRAYAAQTKQVAEPHWLSLQTLVAFGVGALCASMVGLLLLILSGDSRNVAEEALPNDAGHVAEEAVTMTQKDSVPEKPTEASMDDVAVAVVPDIKKPEGLNATEVSEAAEIVAIEKNGGNGESPEKETVPEEKPERKVAVQSVLEEGKFTRYVLKSRWQEARDNTASGKVKLFETSLSLMT